MRIIQTDRPEGNPFLVMAQVADMLRQIHGRSEAVPIIKQYREEAMSGDYENLKTVSKRYVPELIEFAHSSEVETITRIKPKGEQL